MRRCLPLYDGILKKASNCVLASIHARETYLVKRRLLAKCEMRTTRHETAALVGESHISDFGELSRAAHWGWTDEMVTVLSIRASASGKV